MRKRRDVCFIEDELEAFLPDAMELYNIDLIGATWHGPKLDWAWRESDRFYLCEVKDPECIGAVLHNSKAQERVLSMLRNDDDQNVEDE